MSAIGCALGCMVPWVRNDRSAKLGVACEQTSKRVRCSPLINPSVKDMVNAHAWFSYPP